jgi:hypothetical protein
MVLAAAARAAGARERAGYGSNKWELFWVNERLSNYHYP